VPASDQLDPHRPAPGRLVPEWRSGPGGPPVEYGASLVELSEALIPRFRVAGGGPGCLLVLEDLEWADPESAAVLEYLGDNPGRRADRLPGRVQVERAARFARGRATERIDVGRLDGPAVAEMGAACLGGPVDEAVERFLQADADGLPCVEELLVALARSGAIARGDGAWGARRDPCAPRSPVVRGQRAGPCPRSALRRRSRAGRGGVARPGVRPAAGGAHRPRGRLQLPCRPARRG
jgi:hypothetical protein